MKINLMLAYNFCSPGLIFVLKKNNFFFHFNRTSEPDQSILIVSIRERLNSAPLNLKTLEKFVQPANENFTTFWKNTYMSHEGNAALYL